MVDMINNFFNGVQNMSNDTQYMILVALTVFFWVGVISLAIVGFKKICGFFSKR